MPTEEGSGLLAPVPNSIIPPKDAAAAATIASLKRAESARAANDERAQTAWKVLLVCTVFLLIALMALAKRLRNKEHELDAKNERLLAFMERVKTVRFTMPPYAAHETHTNEVLLDVVNIDRNGEPFVAPDWMPHPIKLSTLEAYLLDAFLKKQPLPRIEWKVLPLPYDPPTYAQEDISVARRE